MLYQFKAFKNVLLSFGFLVFISSSALSQGTTSLWKVTAEGSDRIIYLGGSIHILGEERTITRCRQLLNRLIVLVMN